MTSIVFAHANGFPAGTYALLFDALRQQGHQVSAPALLGQDPSYPVSDNWPHLVRQLADFARRQKDARAGAPLVLVGHSLGGILSLMCAAQQPDLAAAVILLDSPIVTGWRAQVVCLAKRLGVISRFSPSRISRQRRTHWPSRANALAHFAAKSAFARWNPQVLQDYMACGMTDTDAGCTLAFTRETESAIYDTIPHQIGALLRHQPLRCPLVFIGGLQSQETRQAGGVRATQRYAEGRITLLDGSHLFPMEHPFATVASIQAHLLALGLAAIPATRVSVAGPQSEPARSPTSSQMTLEEQP